MKHLATAKSLCLILVALAAISLPSNVRAQSPGLVSYTGGTTFGTFESNGDTVGWAFTANQAVIVLQLGFNDVTPGDPLTTPHAVGLWDSAGNLLASVIIQPGSNLISGFRYEAITPVALVIGQTYVLGAFYAADNTNADGYITSATSAVFDPAFTFLGPRRDPSGVQTGLVFPTVVSAGNGRFGPNMLFVIPEPATYGLMGMGLALAAILYRRKRRR